MHKLLLLISALVTLTTSRASEAEIRTNTAPSSTILSINQTGLDLYRLLAEQKPDENILISPLSIYAAFSLLVPGTEGETLAEILSALKWTGSQDAMPDSIHKLLEGVLVRDASNDSVRFEYGNSLWIEDGLDLTSHYDSLMKSIGAEISKIDFESNPDSARVVMNKWADQKTHEKISEPIPSGAIHDTTITVLMNALWMKMTWEAKFDSLQTTDKPFYSESRGKLDVPTMYSMGRSRVESYANPARLQILELPVAGGLWSMQFFLPDSSLPLTSIDTVLSAKQISQWVSNLYYPAKLKTYLPKYNVKQSFSLVSQLKMLGMKKLFVRADLDRMYVNPPDTIFVSDVLHSTFIEVAEEGFEATAVTSVIGDMRTESVEPPPVIFRADHPFFYTITHRETGLIVFCGRIMNPLVAN